MEKIATLFLTLAVMIFWGKNCSAMQQNHELGRNHKQWRQPARTAAGSLGKQCLCDGLKTTIGLSVLGASLFAAFASVIGCNVQPEHMNIPEKMLCSDAGSLTVLTFGGVSVLFTGYQMVNLVKHSCDLAAIAVNHLWRNPIAEIHGQAVAHLDQ